MRRLRTKTESLRTEYKVAKLTVAAEEEELARLTKRLGGAEEAQKILQVVAQSIQQRAHEQIASVVTKCLEAVFDDPYEFRIIFEQKRGRTEARLAFFRGTNEIDDPLDGSGGGVVDVAAFALRLACLVLARPPLRRVLILDEPFKWVSEEYRPRVVALLHQLAEELDVQFILVTHIPEFQTGTIIHV